MRGFTVLFLMMVAAVGHAAEWVAVSQISSNVREVDKDSIKGGKPTLTFNSRHVVAAVGEYRIGRNDVKFLMLEQRLDCTKNTITVLGSEAQRADGSLISKQNFAAPVDNPVLAGSVDDDVLKFVCGKAS